MDMLPPSVEFDKGFIRIDAAGGDMVSQLDRNRERKWVRRRRHNTNIPDRVPVAFGEIARIFVWFPHDTVASYRHATKSPMSPP